MKELRKLYIDHSNGDCGNVVLVTEEPDDAWHLYNLVGPGDRIKSSTVRKVKMDMGSRVVSDKKHVTLTIQVEKSEYDGIAGSVRFSGPNVEENEYVKLGQYHTIEIIGSESQKLTIFKDCWDSIAQDILHESVSAAKAAEVCVLLIDDQGVAALYALTAVLMRELWKTQVNIPRKNRYQASSRGSDKGSKLYASVESALRQNIDFEVVTCLLVAGPGFSVENFMEYLSLSLSSSSDAWFRHNKAKFVTAHCSGAYKHCLNELLNNDEIKNRVAKTKAAMHARALEVFYDKLESDPGRICYGLFPVVKAVEERAVNELLVTDKLFRNVNPTERRRYISLVDSVKRHGGKVHVFSEQHVTGQQLAQLAGGIAALLRYEMAEDDDDMY